MAVQVAVKKPVAQMQQEIKKEMVGLKVKNLKELQSQVVVGVDISPSMQFDHARFFSTGVVDGLLQRCMALGMMLDDNGKVPVFWFNNQAGYWGEMAQSNMETFLGDHYVGTSGSTNYAPVMDLIVQKAEAGDPMLALMFTDGENYDVSAAEKALRGYSNLPIFWQWFGIYAGNRAPSFPFLEKMDTLTGRVVDNAGFSAICLTDIPDSQLYELMLHEYRGYPGVVAASGGKVSWNNLPKKSAGLGGLFRR